MAGLGRKTFSPGDVLTSSDVQGYLMDQSVMVFAGTAARASAIPSPSAGMVAYSTATALQVYNGTAWVDLSTGYGVATGTAASSTAITVSSVNYTLLTFTADSNLVVSKAGLFDVLCFAGAGGGAAGSTAFVSGGGGGGAGGKVVATVYLAATTYAVTVGAGGAGGATSTEVGLQGFATGVTNVLAAVGGGGGLANESSPRFSAPIGRGGCGGGGSTGSVTGGVAILSQGFGGGTGTGGAVAGAGGGGVAAVGQPNVSTTAGAGGTGFDVSTFIGGSTLTKGTGGNGGSGAVAGAAGAANSAVGGTGGGLGTYAGGAGGSGIFYIRFKV